MNECIEPAIGVVEIIVTIILITFAGYGLITLASLIAKMAKEIVDDRKSSQNVENIQERSPGGSERSEYPQSLKEFQYPSDLLTVSAMFFREDWFNGGMEKAIEEADRLITSVNVFIHKKKSDERLERSKMFGSVSKVDKIKNLNPDDRPDVTTGPLFGKDKK